MKFTVDIDNGGTFTDGFFTGGERIEWVKVDTTPHDLTVCFQQCIEEGAKRFGLTVTQLLHESEVIRFSSTHATNTLIQHSGPRLGLIVTRGYEETLYASGHSTALDFIIPSEMVVGIDGQGVLDREQVRLAIRNLLGSGARMIIVSLKGAHLDPSGELKVREIAEVDYPSHYLGAVPLLLSHEVSTTTDETSRTNAALLNAYFHPDMVRFLYKAEDEVRSRGYRKPLLVVHSDGGVARVAKTTAIMTHNSGPSAGVLGTAHISRRYKLPYVASLDIGGTSADISLVINGKRGYTRETAFEGMPVRMPVIEVYPTAAGGGSIARLDNNNSLKLGPESAGSIPGPACYGLGGTEATSTDACVILGYIDPDYFLGGRRKLDAALAQETISRNLAEPLGISLEECSRSIFAIMQDICARDISDLITAGGYNPADFVLFSFGGGGGIYSGGIADKVGIPKVYCFRFSSVFSAFGSSCADVLHSYETLSHLSLRREGNSDQVTDFNNIIKRLMKSALRDMLGEGFRSDQVAFSLELEVEANGKPIVFDSPVNLIENPSDIETIFGAFSNQSNGPADEMKIHLFRLRATSPVAHASLVEHEFAGESPEKSLKGKRNVYWNDGFILTNVYAQPGLECGNVIAGPAVIESEDTTILIPPGKKYTVDSLLNGVIEPD